MIPQVRIYKWANVTVLETAQEAALKPGDAFKECRDCPEMIVAPRGRLTMGSPEGQSNDFERPTHEVTIAKPFAVAKFELTFDDWDACAAHNMSATAAGGGAGARRST